MRVPVASVAPRGSLPGGEGPLGTEGRVGNLGQSDSRLQGTARRKVSLDFYE